MAGLEKTAVRTLMTVRWHPVQREPLALTEYPHSSVNVHMDALVRNLQRFLHICSITFLDTIAWHFAWCLSTINNKLRFEGRNKRIKCSCSELGAVSGMTDTLWHDTQCVCHAFTGLLCHLDDACINNPCKYREHCHTNPVNGKAFCTCLIGFKGPSCYEDVDECSFGRCLRF